MFHAFVLICALGADGNPSTPCTQVGDSRGPYAKEEMCKARGEDVMASILKDPELKAIVGLQLNFPLQITYKTICHDDGKILI